jgi:glycosyltransferase involved in cell wall biosynthesis
VRVLLADPPAFTPTYDHELAAALSRAGAEVELVTAPFRFGEVPRPDGYRRVELFYPVSSRVFRGRSRLRVPLKLLEHPVGLARLRRRPADVAHLQWLAVPQVDRLLRLRAPTVFTAHDLLPRRTAGRRELWRRALERFERVVVHSDRGRSTLLEVGVEPDRVRVIPHPVFPSDVARADDGRTLLCFGVIRPYKGLGDAIEALRLVEGGARLLVAGDPAEPVEPYRAAADGLDVEWRLGYLPQAEVERALGEATVALFPYAPELDQSGALLRALGAGVPAIAYDVGGIAEPVRRFGAGRVVAAGDVEALAEAARELLGDRDALEEARAGVRRARAELTWDAAAAAHLEVYRELL